MKYRIYGKFTGNTGDKSESILWPFISIRASCVSSAWRITHMINTKPWWKWCCATRISSRGSVCLAITSRWQSRPWRPVWPVKAWRSLLTHGWSKYLASVPLVKLPCGWKNGGARGFHPSSRICIIKSIACQTILHRFFSINKTPGAHSRISGCVLRGLLLGLAFIKMFKSVCQFLRSKVVAHSWGDSSFLAGNKSSTGKLLYSYFTASSSWQKRVRNTWSEWISELIKRYNVIKLHSFNVTTAQVYHKSNAGTLYAGNPDGSYGIQAEFCVWY